METSATRVEDIVSQSATYEVAKKIIIADDHELTRESIRSMLESVASEPHLRILAEAKDGQEVIELSRLQRPDLVLMDVRMPRVNGFEAARRIKEELGTTKVLMMKAYHNLEYVSKAIRAGAEGYVPKLAPLKELLEAVRGVLWGEFRYLSFREYHSPEAWFSGKNPSRQRAE